MKGNGVRLAVYAVIGFMFVTDLAWCPAAGLTITGWGWATICACFLLAVALLYRRRSPILSAAAESAALWVAFTAASCVLTYLCAIFARPLQDQNFAELDGLMGFDWTAWHGTVLGSPVLRRVLGPIYASLLPQIFFAVLYLPAMGLISRGLELLLLAAVTLLPTAFFFALFPALGPLVVAGETPSYLPDLLALRAGGPWNFSLPKLEGIITLPSYHTTLALLFAYAFRRTGPVGWVIALLNLLMLLAIPPIGGHYLVDMVAGALITVACALPLRMLTARQAVDSKDYR